MAERLLTTFVKRQAKMHLGEAFPYRFGPARHQGLVNRYRVTEDLLLKDGKVPMRWWTYAPNFGDLLSPWLVEKMTGIQPILVEKGEPSYVATGSILKHVGQNSIVWGTGSFGNEGNQQINLNADYRAVRGPLTRAKVVNLGGECPPVYGDPALLAPLYFFPKTQKSHEIGLVLRWSERKWHQAEIKSGVRLINLGDKDVEGVITEMLSCRRIVTSSLHGLIIADAYGIPSAWLSSSTPKGGEFKFYDYFLTVNKMRQAAVFSPDKDQVTADGLDKAFTFDPRPIEFDYRRLLNACPFIERVPGAAAKPGSPRPRLTARR